MKKHLTTIVLTILLVLSSNITAFAASEVVNVDGVWITFDSEYYAANNPDVVASVGTDANALLQHYITAGQYEGRLCCAPGAQMGTAKILAYELYGSLDVPIIPVSKLVKVIRHKTDGSVKVIDDITYDDKGNLLSFDGNKFIYDQHGNLIRQEWSSNIWMTYDGQGHITLSECYGTIPYENFYDSEGKLIEHIQHEGREHDMIYRVKYTYDAARRLVTTVGKYDHKRDLDFVETRTYNEKGLLTYKTQGVELEALPFPGYDQDVQASLSYDYDYDELGRLARQTYDYYEYDSRGNMVKITHTRPEGSGKCTEAEYIYE